MAKKLAKKQVGGSQKEKPKSTSDIVKAGIKAGFKIDQGAAFKAGLDTNKVINMSKKGEPGFAGVKKNVKKTGGAIKTKKK